MTVRAAGMPLADGALPPGSLTVRVVRGSFSADLPNVTVHLDVDGRDTHQQVTGAQGRAEFAHLPVGARARAWAVVENERLESDSFQVSGDSGLRVLLIAGAGAGAAVDAGHGLPAAAAAASPTTAVADPAADAGQGATIVRVVVASITVLAFALAGLRLRRGRPTSTPPRDH